MIILDTNVVSELSRPSGNARVLAWLNSQLEQNLFLTAINLAEILEGVSLLPDGKRKQVLRVTMNEVVARFVHPILPFDRQAAEAYASLVARAKAKNYTLPIADAQIAAIAAVHGFAVATRDVEPFRAAGVKVINPWEQ
jgi:predicted nucleic acid-binding protein